MEVESFVSLGLFTQKYSNLTSVTLMTTPASDSHLLPAVIPSITISDRYACLYVNMALKFSAKLEKLSVDEVNAEPLLEALAKSPRQLHCLHTLVVANTELEICNVAHIGAMLPALVDLEYSASSFATTIGSSKSVCSKIDNVTVNWRPSANENNVLGADTLEQMTAYAAYLSFQVPSTRRIQFASNEQTAITECNTQLQEMCTQPCIVKLVKQTTLQNVFSLCQST
ncbi:hypothetical protein J3F82_001974 [Coemansia sp. RSA 637]|nr:hypothetical protein J3F82_001974 [Coemansia sp. RSA 637]